MLRCDLVDGRSRIDALAYRVARAQYLLQRLSLTQGDLVGTRPWGMKDILEGALRGLGVGGAFRYEDGQVYGYRPFIDADGNTRVDITTQYKDPSRETFDFWLSYSHKLTDKIDYRIQLNLRNIFGKNELVPRKLRKRFKV